MVGPESRIKIDGTENIRIGSKFNAFSVPPIYINTPSMTGKIANPIQGPPSSVPDRRV